MKKNLFSMLMLMILLPWTAFAADYGLPANIQDGNILHCFDWKATDVQAELDNIAKAGFTAVQLSPCQGNANNGAEWFYAYMPYDFAFKATGVGTKAQLTALCAAAHERGIKIIVDVVANHVNQAAGYHDTWWDAGGRVRWNGGINYGDRYSITHGQLGEYGDVNSELAEVQTRAKAYVEELKACGVDGIRWDAAKHIALPSEGCNFWATVTSVSGMWHYGEILDSPGGNGDALMKEYTKYMSVTDNGYCNGVRNAVKGGGVPTGYAGWAAATIADSKVVYWAESHDDYSNEWQASTNIPQDVIDRTWAIVACRNGASSLYFSRPAATTRTTIKMGQKGSTHFTSKEIAAINKLKNVAVGHPDYFSSSNGVVSVTRKDVGAAIIKGNGQAGNVSIANGGGYCPAGSYKDLVSGNTFTVTATTISGNVGNTGIAVLVKDGSIPDPDPTPDPDPSDDYVIYFDNTNSNWVNPYIHYWGGDSQSTWPGMAMTKVEGNVWKAIVAPNTTGCLFNAGDGDATKTADFKAVNGHIYNTSGDQGAYNPGPTKPTVTISPNGGTVRGGSNITVNVSSDATSVTATFNDRAVPLSAGANTIEVNSYLGDGETATLSVTAANEVGSTKAEASFTRKDNTPDPTPGTNLITDYYKVNPNGQSGTRKTVNVTSGQKNGALTHWEASDLIAQGVARDVCMAFRGKHERPVVDSYAMYAAYDNTNLYLGVQMVYTVWDEYGEGYQPGESKPYNMDGKLMVAFDLDPDKECNGTLTNGASVWFDKEYTTFGNGMDCMWLGSTKPGVGDPGLFKPNASGKFDYNDPASCIRSKVAYGYDDGLLPSIDAIWGQADFGYDPELLTGNTGFVDLRDEVKRLGGNDSAHTFYEFAFPLADLGVTADYIETFGIGVMFLDVYGSSAHASMPYDPCFYDKVFEPYSQDKSTSAEKEDQNHVTYSMARVGKIISTGVEDITVEDADDTDVAPVYYTLQGARVERPAAGIYIVVRGSKVTKEYIR